MRVYVLISGVIFGIVAIVHAYRLVVPWPIVIAGWSVPLWVSAAGVLVAGALSAWAIRLSLN